MLDVAGGGGALQALRDSASCLRTPGGVEYSYDEVSTAPSTPPTAPSPPSALVQVGGVFSGSSLVGHVHQELPYDLPEAPLAATWRDVDAQAEVIRKSLT